MSDAAQERRALAQEHHATLTSLLLPRVKKAKALLDKHREDLEILRALEADIQKLRTDKVQELNLLKDIGCGVLMQATVPDTSRIYVSVGLGFYAEATLEEASTILSARSAVLQQLVTEASVQVAEIEADVRLIQEGISSLQ